MSTALGAGRRDPNREVHLDFPAGFPKARIEPLFDDRIETSGEFRRAVTATDPLLFALVYLQHQLVLEREDEKTGELYDLVSLSEWHLDLIQQARLLKSRRPQRSGWIVPRKGAKTTWFDICALWALAHGHRRTIVIFSATQAQAREHLANLRREFDGNALLVQDFPDLAPTRVKGSRDTLSTVTRGGGTVAARSIGEQVRGTKFGSDRPDLIFLDDVEPDASNYSIETKQKRLDTILSSILPMNEDAAVMLAGTTVMYGSIAHDLVLSALGERHAPWIGATGFVGHYYPAIMDEGRHNERSLWPAMWALGWLKRRRGPIDRVDRIFALEYLNRPEAAGGGTYWTRETIIHDLHFEAAGYVMTVDTAVTTTKTADMTAIAIVSIDATGTRLCVEHVEAGRIPPEKTRDRMHFLKRLNPTLRTAIVEVNQGGNLWRRALSPFPPGMTIEDGRPDKRGSKRERTEWLCDLYARGVIVHRREFPELEDMMIAWPKVTHDDLLDAVEAGVAFHLGLPIK